MKVIDYKNKKKVGICNLFFTFKLNPVQKKLMAMETLYQFEENWFKNKWICR